MTNKADQRALLLARREALTDAERVAASDAVARNLAAEPAFARARRVLAYAAMRGELDLFKVVREAIESGRTVGFPQVDWASRRIICARWRDASVVRPGRYGVPELPEPIEPLDPTLIDLALIPAVGYDRLGYRLGYGGGFYDRLLPCLRPDCRCWGVAFSVQVVDELPREAHDRRVEAIVTEQGVWVVGESP